MNFISDKDFLMLLNTQKRRKIMMKFILAFFTVTLGFSAFATPKVVNLEAESMEYACFVSVIEATNQAISKGLQAILAQSTQACDHEHYNVTDISVETVRKNPDSCPQIEVSMKATCVDYESHQ